MQDKFVLYICNATSSGLIRIIVGSVQEDSDLTNACS